MWQNLHLHNIFMFSVFEAESLTISDHTYSLSIEINQLVKVINLRYRYDSNVHVNLITLGFHASSIPLGDDSTTTTELESANAFTHLLSKQAPYH